MCVADKSPLDSSRRRGGGYYEQVDCKKNLVVFNLADFSLERIDEAIDIIESLNGRHIFLQGSHDKWLKGFDSIPERKFF